MNRPLVTWAAAARKAAETEYYRGFLIVDRDTKQITRTQNDDACAALSLAIDNAAHLYQRRIGPGEFAYIIRLRRAPTAAELARADTITLKDMVVTI